MTDCSFDEFIVQLISFSDMDRPNHRTKMIKPSTSRNRMTADFRSTFVVRYERNSDRASMAKISSVVPTAMMVLKTLL